MSASVRGPLFVMVTPADMIDRNAAMEVLFRLRLMHPEIHHRLGRLRLCRTARDLGEDIPESDDQDHQPSEEHPRVCRPAPALGRRRTLTRLDHARPQTRPRLRTAHPALGIAHHLGRDQPQGQAHHPPKFPQKRTAGLPRSATGLIVLALAVTTVTGRPCMHGVLPILPPPSRTRQPNRRSEHIGIAAINQWLPAGVRAGCAALTPASKHR